MSFITHAFLSSPLIPHRSWYAFILYCSIMTTCTYNTLHLSISLSTLFTTSITHSSCSLLRSFICLSQHHISMFSSLTHKCEHLPQLYHLPPTIFTAAGFHYPGTISSWPVFLTLPFTWRAHCLLPLPSCHFFRQFRLLPVSVYYHFPSVYNAI